MNPFFARNIVAKIWRSQRGKLKVVAEFFLGEPFCVITSLWTQSLFEKKNNNTKRRRGKSKQWRLRIQNARMAYFPFSLSKIDSDALYVKMVIWFQWIMNRLRTQCLQCRFYSDTHLYLLPSMVRPKWNMF